MNDLLNKTESPRLRFDSTDDALNFASQSIEDSKRFLATHSLNVLEGYEKGDLEIALKLGIGTFDSKYDLILTRDPNRRIWDGDSADSAFPTSSSTFNMNSDLSKQRVLIPIAYYVQGPEQVIPTLVWFECSKKRVDYFNAFPSSKSISFKSITTCSEGELPPSNDVTSLIERRSQVADGIEGYLREIGWKGSELDLVKHLAGNVRVWVGDRGVTVFVSLELHAFLPKISDVILCSRDHSM